VKEDFLHYVWKYLRFDLTDLHTTEGLPIQIINNGLYLQESGPDFFNAKIQIGDQLWAGNVEVHVYASDWYAHHHQDDIAYQNVILHVVWENDCTVMRSANESIPTLELKPRIAPELIDKYLKKIIVHSELPCKNQLSTVSIEKIHWFQEELLIKRLNEKCSTIAQKLAQNTNYWESAFIQLLAKNFGTKVNGAAFEATLQSIPYAILQKLRHDINQLEAVLFGQSNILPEPPQDAYTRKLSGTYLYLKHKFQLNPTTIRMEFFKLRPDNFPSIRMSQFAQLIAKYDSLFFEMLSIHTHDELIKFFHTKANDYWNNHFVFDKPAQREKEKKTSKAFIELILINTVLPFQYAYYKDRNADVLDRVVGIYHEIAFEDNAITKKYDSRFFRKQSAADSQSLLYLNRYFCQDKKCLHCTIGTTILNKHD